MEVENRRRSWSEMKFPARGERATPFLRRRPSCTGVMEMLEAPMSITRAEGLPDAKLGGGAVSRCKMWAGGGLDATYAARTPLRASQNAGHAQFSIAISIAFSRLFPEFQPVSVISKGFSSSGFSCSSTPSISTSISPFDLSFRPFVIGLPGLAFVRREVIAYSHRFVAVSQSSTVPSLDIGFSIDMLGNGVCIDWSPKRHFRSESEDRTP